MGTRLGRTLLALYSLAAVTTAQSDPILPAGCFMTSTVIYGNATSSSTSPSSTTGAGQLGVSPIPTLSASSSINSKAVTPSSSTSIPLPLSSSIDSAVLTISPPSTSPTLTTTTASGLSTTAPTPVSTPFHIVVSGFNSKLRARGPSYYIGFAGNNAYISPYEDLSSIFVLFSNGQLQVGDSTVGTEMPGNETSLALLKFSGSIQPSGYTWAFNGSRLVFGDNLVLSAVDDGQIYVTFPGYQPSAGDYQLELGPEYVASASSSTSISPITSVEVSTAMSEGPSISTSEALTFTSGTWIISSIGAVSSLPATPTTIQNLSPSPSPSSQLIPDRPLTSSTAIHTSAGLPSSSPSVARSSIPSLSLQVSSSSPSSPPIPSTKSSIVTPVSLSSSVALLQSTTLQVNPITLVSPTTTGLLSSSAPSPLSSSAAASSATALSTTASPSPTTAVSIGAPVLSSTVSLKVSTSSTSVPSTTSAYTSPSSQGGLTIVSTTTSLAQGTTGSPSSSLLSSSTITTTTTTTRRTYTGSRTRTSSSTSTSPTFNPIPNPYPAKRGLAYRNVTTLGFYPPPSPYIDWSYNYYSLPNASDNVGPYSYPSAPYRFIPLLYNDAQSLTSIWSANVNFSIANYGTDAIFGFNEPDANFNGQSSNMPVQQSITGYRNFMQPFAGRVKIGAPAVTNTGGGLAYLQQFLGNASQQNQNLTLDFINIHWYASPYSIDYFKSFLLGALNISLTYSPNITSSYVNTANGGILPIWITEFGMDQNFYDINQNAAFLRNASLWMDEQSWVERYAWFGNFPEGNGMYGGSATNMLLNYDGSGRSVLGDVWYTYNGTN